jgi:anti-sigma28 factor (negative regulator of flagellin synthesis)
MIRNVGINQSRTLVNETTKNEQKAVTKRGDNQASRLDKLKEQIKNGEYAIDIKATATKMAQEIMP